MLRLLSVFSTVTLIVSILYSQIAEEAILPKYMLAIVLLSLLPFFFALSRYVARNFRGIRGKHIFVFRLLSLSLALLLVLFAPADTLTLVSLIFFLFVIFGLADARMLFALALVHIVAVPLFLLVMRQDYAEYFSVQAYYALVLGTLALLLSDRLSNALSTIVAPVREPKWWTSYTLELRNLSESIASYLPYGVLALLLAAYSPLDSVITFDERFMMSVTLIMWALLPLAPPLGERWKYSIITLSVLTYIFMFETYIEGMIAIILYLGVIFLFEYQSAWISKWLHTISHFFRYDSRH